MVSAAGAGSPLAIAIHGDKARYDTSDYLTVHLINLLAAANWQRQGNKRAPKPKQFLLPGMEPEGKKTFGSEPIPIDEFQDWWARAA